MEQRLTAQLRTKNQRRRAALATSHAAASAVRPRNDLLPKLQLVERNIDDLSAPARNVRTADPAHVREIANAIATLGFSVPVLIDQDGRVLDGWARVEAARQMGLRRLPCVVASHLTAAEGRLLRVAVNRLGEKGNWDLGALKIELDELILEDMPVVVSGFSEMRSTRSLLMRSPRSPRTARSSRTPRSSRSPGRVTFSRLADIWLPAATPAPPTCWRG